MKTPILRAIIAASLTVCFGTLSSGWAAAQTADDIIRSFNQAKRSGSIADRVSASEALGAFAIANPDEEDAFILGYEAAQTLCRLGECAAAVPITDWLATQAPDAEVEPTDLAVLIALANWSEKPRGKQRKALDEALGAIVDRAPSLLSVVAFQRRYSSDLSAQSNWGRAAESAGDAADHFAQAKGVIGMQWSDARTSELAARFNNKRAEQTVLNMAKHERDLGIMINEARDDEGNYPEWLDDHKYRADAWRMAMEAYFLTNKPKTTAQRLINEAKEVVGEFGGPTVPPGVDEEEPEQEGLPFCAGRFDMKPSLQYPSGAAQRGLFGAAIMRITVADGEVSEVEALAAVPFEGFKESAAKTIAKWKWITTDDGVGVTCGLDRENIVLPLTFSLG
ncbi:MAG: energy transducer TonB [Pseudomonadota bacterium]